jgi:L-asparaginase / beta-aspartyl-peptidase
MRTYFKLLLLGASLALLSAALLRPCLLAAEDPNERDRAAITRIFDAQQAAWNRGDVNVFMEAYWHSPDVSFSGSGGIVRGWDAVLARYKAKYTDRQAMGQLSFSGLEFRFVGPDAALVLGHWHLTLAKGDAAGVFSLVWQRFPEGWRIIHDHTSLVSDAK